MSKSITYVHKDGEEGGITIDATTGAILTPHIEQPDWAAGLACANLGERISFYQKHLGDDAQAVRLPGYIEVSDLSWEAMVQEGGEVKATTIPASLEYRTTFLNGLGYNGPVTLNTPDYPVLAEVEIGLHDGPAEDEVAAFNRSVVEAQERGLAVNA